MSPETAAAPSTVGALRRQAQGATSPAVERAVGRLLGASAVTAEAAVAALRDAERLGDGLAVCALVLAARRGIDAAAAVAELAAGRPLPGGWSDFELRVAREEGEEELGAALRTATHGPDAVIAVGRDAPSDVVQAIRTGRPGGPVVLGAAAAHRQDGLALLRAVVDHGWLRRLAAAAGRPTGARAGAEALQALIEGGPEGASLPPGADHGADEVCRRAAAYLSLLPAGPQP